MLLATGPSSPTIVPDPFLNKYFEFEIIIINLSINLNK
jgi:hypothetical protein